MKPRPEVDDRCRDCFNQGLTNQTVTKTILVSMTKVKCDLVSWPAGIFLRVDVLSLFFTPDYGGPVIF